MAERAQKLSLFDPAIVRRAMRDSVIKLHPRTLMRNPVMFVVEVVAAVTTIFFVRDLFGGTESSAFVGQIAASVGFTIYSWLVGNWVFVVTNAVMILNGVVGLLIVLHHRRREQDNF